MVVYNYCSRCGRRIKIALWEPLLSLSLESTRKAICSKCDPRSKWEPIYSYEFVGTREDEVIFKRKINDFTITGIMKGVKPRIPNLIIERSNINPIMLSYSELVRLYKGKLSLDSYTKIPLKIREHVFLAVCDILKFRSESKDGDVDE